MKHKLLFAGLLCLIFLAVSSCDDSYIPEPWKTNYSLNQDGSNFVRLDNRMLLEPWGTPYYISEDLVLHVRNKIYSRSLDSNQVRQLLPDLLSLTDNENIAIDLDAQKLYFSANNHIYTCNFSGAGLTDLSPNETGTLLAPALSEDNNYLTAIRAGQILRLNLQSGQWEELAGPQNARYAIYQSSKDRYYYYASSTSPVTNYLYSWDPESGLATQIMQQPGNPDSIKWGTSTDRRFFVLHKQTHPYYGNLPEDLLLYDSETGIIQQIDQCFAFSFDPAHPQLYYSRQMWGMADLNCLDLDSGESRLLWDGFNSEITYSYSIGNIFLRADGAHLFLSGWTAYKRDNNKTKDSLTAPGNVRY